MSGVFSSLVKEPFNLSIEEIGRLTPYQVKNIFFRPKEADEPVGEFQSEKELFWKVHADWKGLTEDETQKLWDRHVRKQEESLKTPPENSDD